MSTSLAALACATTLALGGAAFSAPAAQADVGTPAHCEEILVTPNGEGYAITKGAYHLKSFAYADCPNVASLPSGKKLYLHCHVHNSYGHTWYYVREQGTNTYGWISADSITVHPGDDDGDGAYEPATCGTLH